jgi:hypothetical protein
MIVSCQSMVPAQTRCNDMPGWGRGLCCCALQNPRAHLTFVAPHWVTLPVEALFRPVPLSLIQQRPLIITFVVCWAAICCSSDLTASSRILSYHYVLCFPRCKVSGSGFCMDIQKGLE